jgi:hypothetical protein
VTVYQEGSVSETTLPDFLTFQDEWGLLAFTQRDWPDESIYRRGYEVSCYSESSYVPTYQDYSVFYANEWLKRGVGLYWDNCYPRPSFSLRTTAAYVTEDGSIQPALTIWGLRDHSKRTWNLLQYWRRHQPYPLVWMRHMTNAELLPIQTWGTSQLDIEMGGTEPFSPDFMRTECTGRQVGNEGWTLYQLYGRDNSRLKNLKEGDTARNDWGMGMVHEARIWHLVGNAVPLEKLVSEFGYGRDDIRVGNYWDEAPLAVVNNDQVRWLVLANPQSKEVLMVLSSWLADATTVEVALNEKALGFAPGRAAVDAESQQPAGELKEGRIQVEMSGPYGVRLIRFGRAGGTL